MFVTESISRCVVCESLMGAFKGILEDDTVDGEINEKLEKGCGKLPHKMENIVSMETNLILLTIGKISARYTY